VDLVDPTGEFAWVPVAAIITAGSTIIETIAYGIHLSIELGAGAEKIKICHEAFEALKNCNDACHPIECAQLRKDMENICIRAGISF